MRTVVRGDRTLRFFDFEVGSKDYQFKLDEFNPFGTFDFSPDEKWIAIGHYFEGPIQILDAKTGRLQRSFGPSKGNSSVNFSPDGERVVAVGVGGYAKIWNAVTGEELVTLPHPKDFFAGAEGKGWVAGAEFSPNGNIVATCCRGSQPLRLFDSRSGRLLRDSSPLRFQAVKPSFSPDGKLVVCGTNQGKVLWWRYETEEPDLRPGHGDAVTAIDFSPNGARLVSGSKDGKVLVWDVKNRRIVLTLPAGPKGIWSVEFSPDGKSIVASGDTGKIMIWESEPVSDDVARKRLDQRLSPPALGR